MRVTGRTVGAGPIHRGARVQTIGNHPIPTTPHVDTLSSIEAVGEPTGDASSLRAQQAVLVMTGWGKP